VNYVALGILVVVLGAVIARQVLGRGPGVWAMFLAGGFVTVVSGVLPPSGAESAVAASAPVLLFLLALFLFAGALDRAGALDHLARWIIGRARRAEELPVALFVGFGVASAFLVNDALVLIGVPLLVALAARIRLDPKPLLLVLAFSVTVGSVLTPFGNPQNLLVSVDSGLGTPVVVFLEYLAVPTALNLAVGAWYLRRVFARSMRAREAEFAEVRAHAPPLFPVGGWSARIRRSPVLVVFPGTMVVLITLDIVSALTGGPAVPVWETAAGGAVLLLLLSPQRTRIVEKVDWTVLLLFAGIFVVVAGAVAGGVVQGAESVLPIPRPGNTFATLGVLVPTSLVGSQLVSNVPWVALQIPILTGLGYGGGTPLAWVGLAAASTLAGNVTLLGAASNLIIAQQAEKRGLSFGLGPFVRYGLPLAALTVAILFVCLALGV